MNGFIVIDFFMNQLMSHMMIHIKNGNYIFYIINRISLLLHI